MNELDPIALRHGTSKSSKFGNYTESYESVLGSWRDRKLVLLEIGVCLGASLRMWEEFLPHARIYGIDEEPAAKEHETARSQVRIGDQSDPSFLEQVVEETGPLDLIIDDGSHHSDHQLASLAILFPHLRNGGIYVIEDLACAFSPRFGPHAGLKKPGSSIEYLKSLLDVIHAHPDFGGRIGDEISSAIGGILHRPQIVFLFKRSSECAAENPAAPDKRSQLARSPLHHVRSARGCIRAQSFRLHKFFGRLASKLSRRPDRP